MIQAKCIEKIRDKNNNIIGYKLIDKNKNEVAVKAERLKEVIKSGQLEVINLTLTSDNRLIDKQSVTSLKSTTTPSKPTTTHSKLSTKAVIDKAKGKGYSITAFDTDCGHKCYLASSPDNTEHILIIPDDVRFIYDKNIRHGFDDIFGCSCDIAERIADIRGKLKVIGGKGLTSTTYMFCRCEVQSLDLSSFDTSNITDMSRMFFECGVPSLDLRYFDTSRVTNMRSMFDNVDGRSPKSINLSSFNTSKVTDMESMFRSCKAQSLDLSSFDTSKVTNMKNMFSDCRAHSIYLNSFDTSKVTNMRGMFYWCRAKSLDLKAFNTSKVTDMAWMFYRYEAIFIDLRSFDTSKVTDMSHMFKDCTSYSIETNDPKILDELKRR